MSFVELIKAVSDRSGIPRRHAREVLKAFLAEAQTTLKTGERIVLPGFGVFFIQKTKAGTFFGGTRTSTGREKISFRQSRSK